MKRLKLILGILILNNLTNFLTVYAQEAMPDVDWISGPKKITLGDNLSEITVSKHYLFANSQDAKKLMTYIGNKPTNRELGLIVPNEENKSWFVLLEYNPLGYVKDNETIDADKLLEAIKQNTERANEERKQKNIPVLHIKGWYQKPQYDQKTHNLVWAVLAESQNHSIINFTT